MTSHFCVFKRFSRVWQCEAERCRALDSICRVFARILATFRAALGLITLIELYTVPQQCFPSVSTAHKNNTTFVSPIRSKTFAAWFFVPSRRHGGLVRQTPWFLSPWIAIMNLVFITSNDAMKKFLPFFLAGALVHMQINYAQCFLASNHEEPKVLVFESFSAHAPALNWLVEKLLMLQRAPFASGTDPHRAVQPTQRFWRTLTILHAKGRQHQVIVYEATETVKTRIFP